MGRVRGLLTTKAWRCVHGVRRRWTAAMSLVIGLIAGALVAGGQSGVAWGSVSPSQARGQSASSLTYVNVGLDWGSLDPALGQSLASDQPIFALIYGDLLRINSKDKIVPDLATSYRVSNNGLSIELNLRHGVKFQDGTPFDANAVASSLLRDIDPKNACQCLDTLQAVQSVRATGPYQVTLGLKSASPSVISALATTNAAYVVSPTALQTEGAAFGTRPVGAGPFTVQSNSPGSVITVRRWPGYWNAGSIHLQTIRILAESQSSSAYEALQAGTAQLVGGSLDPVTVEAARANASVSVVSPPATLVMWLQFNDFQPPFDNKLARQAVFYATNPALISKSVLLGQDPTTENLLGPGVQGSFGRTIPNFPKHSLAKARQAVNRLGGLSFSVMPVINSDEWITLTEALVKEWSAAGMHVTIQQFDHTQAVSRLHQGNYQALVNNFGSWDPAETLNRFLVYPSLSNKNFSDPEVNRMVAQATATYSTAARSRLFNAAVRKAVVDDFGFVPLVIEPTNFLQAKGVRGIPKTPTQLYLAEASVGGA